MIRFLVLSSRIVVPPTVHPVNQPQEHKGKMSAKKLDMECQVILEFIWYPLFEMEVEFYNGVILLYLEVAIGLMHDCQ